MAEFRYPDGSWPRPIKEVAAAISCIDGTTSANQAEHLYHASGHYYGGLAGNVHHPLRCQRVPCSWLASTEEQMANHIRGHEKFNLLDRDGSFDGLYALLQAAQPPPRSPPGFRLGEPPTVSQRPRPSPQTRPQSSRPGPSSRSGLLKRTGPSLRRRPQSPRLMPLLLLLRAGPRNPGARVSPPLRPRLFSRLGPSTSRLSSPAPPSPLSPPASTPAPPSAPPPPAALPPSLPSPNPIPIPPPQSVTLEGVFGSALEGSPKRRSPGSGSPGTIPASSPATASRTPETLLQVPKQPEYSLLAKSAIPISEPHRAASPEFPSPNTMFLPMATKEPRNVVTTPSQLHVMTRHTFTTILPFKKRMLTVATVNSPVGTGKYAAYTKTASSKKFKWWEKVISARSLDESPQAKAHETQRLPADSSTETNEASGSRKRKQQRYPESTS